MRRVSRLSRPVATVRKMAKPAMAIIGKRWNQMLTPSPKPRPGVDTPWASMKMPTERHPRAMRTNVGLRERSEATAAATATTSAEKEMAETTIRWKLGESRRKSRLGVVLRRNRRRLGSTRTATNSARLTRRAALRLPIPVVSR